MNDIAFKGQYLRTMMDIGVLLVIGDGFIESILVFP